MKLYVRISVVSDIYPIVFLPQKSLHTPVLALGVVLKLALDHVNHDIVANQTTLVHDLLSLPSQVGLLRDL